MYYECSNSYFCAVFNKYRKRRIHNTANLLTGESDVAPGTIKVAQGATNVEPDIISYYHQNMTINLVEDYTRWTQGSIPQPLDKCEFFLSALKFVWVISERLSMWSGFILLTLLYTLAYQCYTLLC